MANTFGLLTIRIGGVDKFRIKVWMIGGGVVYDNMMGMSDNSDPSTVLGGGKIIIHAQ